MNMDHGLLLCAGCHRYFEQATGLTPFKYEGVQVVTVRGHDLCKRCAEKDVSTKADSGEWVSR